MTDPAEEQTLAEKAPSRFECRSCGYVYEPNQGDNSQNIPPGTPFKELPEGWRCPVCGAARNVFVDIGAVDAPSGFEPNLSYGFGVNRLTPKQKNILIFGALALAFVMFISFYALN